MTDWALVRQDDVRNRASENTKISKSQCISTLLRGPKIMAGSSILDNIDSLTSFELNLSNRSWILDGNSNLIVD